MGRSFKPLEYYLLGHPQHIANHNGHNLNYPAISTVLEPADNVQFYNDVKSALSAVNNDYKTDSLWHLFILAALLFLLLEIGLLKFLKS